MFAAYQYIMVIRFKHMTADANMTCLAYVFVRCFDEREFTKVIKHGSNMS